jgi:hypothetical protein
LSESRADWMRLRMIADCEFLLREPLWLQRKESKGVLPGVQ